ncbi:long-subunit fatty acid transport protein [Dysgonomonadaceae bacterium PH5-43]|nr:long-subunit fatty acid transport protein [Dysgonomonadaceae bacterium PH5-43]
MFSMKKNILVIAAIVVCGSLFAQGEVEALRSSKTELQGTARGQAMGGAFGALGGDVTGVMINPAGLGVYRSSEVNITGSLSSVDVNSKIGGLSKDDNKFNANIDNLSYIGYFPLDGDNMRSFNFGFSYNRQKNFNRRYKSMDAGRASSLSDYITTITDGINADILDQGDPYYDSPWLSALAWQAYIIDPGASDYEYNSILQNGETSDARLNVLEKGQIESYDFSLATNISDNFYIGATLALTDIYYRQDSYYTEKFARGDFALENYHETEGYGFQLRVGAIWSPLDFLRVGVAYSSPTWYSMTDYYKAFADATYYDAGGEYINKSAETPSSAFTEYKFHSPYSWTFSIAGILDTKAILSLDYEIKDYRSMNYSFEGIGSSAWEDNENSYIDDDYRVASTLRMGLEYRFTPQFAGRLGFAFVQNPYETTYRDGERETIINGTIPHFTVEGDATYVTTGIGYRFTPNFYADLAFVYRTQTDKLYYYSSAINSDYDSFVISDPANLKTNSVKGLLTLGYKF